MNANMSIKTGKLLLVKQEISHADLETVNGGLTIPKFIRKASRAVSRWINPKNNPKVQPQPSYDAPGGDHAW